MPEDLLKLSDIFCNYIYLNYIEKKGTLSKVYHNSNPQDSTRII